MRALNCPEHALLLAYQRGELSVSDFDNITAHLDGCPTCEAAAQALDDSSEPILDVLRKLPAGEREALKQIDARGPFRDLTRDAIQPRERKPGDAFPSTLALRREGEPPAPVAIPMPTRLGTYEVLEEIGRGGMGVVYKAWHPGLRRFVALKVVLAGAHASADATIRFHREAELIARLSHPNLVQIYEIGQHNGLPFIALEYIPGGSLDHRLAGQPQPGRVAAELVALLAEAVHTAHENGVVHRDLKPANVLLDEDGTPKITDFGLAKKLDEAGRTATGAIMGTPSYMSPEQVAHPETTGPPADIYALGAILYECLTGRPPFRADSPHETFRQILDDEPVSPRTLQPRLPRDLATVCLKCLEKNPQRRYASASALVDDLRRYLHGQPVLARPISTIERTLKWARRSPTVAGLLLSMAGGALLSFALVFFLWTRAEERANEAATAWQKEESAHHEAASNQAREKRARQETERVSGILTIEQGVALCDQGDIAPGLLTLVEGLTRSELAQDTTADRLARLQLASWQHQFVRSIASLRHTLNVTSVAFSRDGLLAATGSRDGVVQLWDARRGTPSGPPLRHPLAVFSVTFSPDSKMLLTGSGPEGAGEGEVSLWEIAAPARPVAVLRQPRVVVAVAFSAGGERFLARSPTQVQVWQTAGRVPLREPLQHEGVIECAVFSPDGKLVLTGGTDKIARLWDAETGRSRGELAGHRGSITCVEFSPNGQLALTGSVDRTARLWDMAKRTPHGLLMYHQGVVRAVAFGSSGETLATGCALMEFDVQRNAALGWAGAVRLWDINGSPLGLPFFHPSPVWSIALDPTEQFLATGAEDGKARVFVAGNGMLLGNSLQHSGTVRQIAFSPDGTTVLGAGDGGDNKTGAAARLWRLPEQPSRKHLPALGWRTSMRSLAYSPDGRLLFGGCQEPDHFTAVLLDAYTGRQLLAPLEHPQQLTGVGVSPNGNLLATTSYDGVLRIFERRTGKLLHSCKHVGVVSLPVFSPDSQLLATTWSDQSVRVWRVTDGKLEGKPLKHPVEVRALNFSTDEGMLWTVGDDDIVRQGDYRSGELQVAWSRPKDLHAPTFQADQRTMLTAVTGGRGVQIRDLRTGRSEGTPFLYPSSALQTLAASPDGSLAVSAGGKIARLWDLPTGKHVGPALSHHSNLLSVAFAPNGTSFAVGGDSTLQVYEVPEPLGGTPEQIRLWAELLTGQRRDAAGVVYDLTAAEMQQRRTLLEQSGGLPHGARPLEGFSAAQTDVK